MKLPEPNFFSKKKKMISFGRHTQNFEFDRTLKIQFMKIKQKYPGKLVNRPFNWKFYTKKH